jgi:hypothetical protein
VVVNVGVGTVHIVPGPPQASIGIGLSITQFNLCTGVSLVNAGGGSSEVTVTVARDLSTAHATGTLLVDDGTSGTSFPIIVDLTWTATGDPAHENVNPTVVIPGGTVQHVSFNGTFREASASGTVSDGTTNYTPGPSSTAQIETDRNTQVTVTVP